MKVCSIPRERALFLSATNKEKTVMGDKSPKATQKQAAQKLAKTNSANQKKKDEATAKQVGNKKK